MGTELKHRPRDPFKVDVQQALEALRLEWGCAYQVTWYEGLYCAQRIGAAGALAGEPLSGETPDELERALRQDWGESP